MIRNTRWPNVAVILIVCVLEARNDNDSSDTSSNASAKEVCIC